MRFIRQFFQVLTAPFRMLFRLPRWILSAPGKLFGLTLPMRVAVVIFLLLLTCFAVAFLTVLLGGNEPDFWVYLLRPQTIGIVVLMVVIPIVVYYGLKSWLEKEVALYPDLDEAWQAGVAALQEQGLELDDLPLFLILGAANSQEVRTLFAATRKKFLVKHVPASRSPLHWYADEDAIYLVLLDASQLSHLNSLSRGTRSNSAPDADGSPAGGQNIRGTIEANQFFDQGESSSTWQPEASVGDAAEPNDLPPMVQGTLVPGAAPLATSGDSPHAAPRSGSQVMTRREAELQTARLQHLCRLLIRTRQPLCPMNGIMTLLPFPVIRDVVVAQEIPAAVQSDLAAIQQVTQLCCSVTALVTGMESEDGFTELVRRVGAGRAKANRFGKGYNVWNAPTQENLDAFTAHACGAFEDWVYSLFREPGGLDKQGNAKLYSLLCRIRSEARGRLRRILIQGYSHDPDDGSSERATMLFSGCYFAATGDSEDQRAFVCNAFEKMSQLEEDLDWTDRAWDEDDRYLALSKFFMGLSGLVLIGMIAMVAYKYFGAGR